MKHTKRDGLAARPLPRQPFFFVCPRPGPMASTPAHRPLIPLPQLSLPVRRPTSSGLQPRATPCLVPHIPAPLILVPHIPAPLIRVPHIPAPLIRVPHIRVSRTWVQAIRVLLIRAISRLLQARRDTWASGSISTVIYPFRSRNGCCAATPISAVFPPQISSGSSSSCIR